MFGKKRVLITAAAAAGVIAAGASATRLLPYGSPTGEKYGSWAPGSSAAVSALDRAPVAGTLPPTVIAHARRMASATGGDEAVAASSLRRLRRNLGVLGSDLYVFRPAAGHGAVCYILTRRGGTCPTAASSPHPGLAWVIDGGFPAVVDGAPVRVPTAVDGVVADNIRSLTLISNGQATPLQVVNNTFYEELAEPSAQAEWNLELRVLYADGTEKVVPVGDPRS